MSRYYEQHCGRLVVKHNPTYGNNEVVTVACRDGWNDSCRMLVHLMSIEEAHDLHYLLGRMIAAAEEK